jgi:hypothetical protein
MAPSAISERDLVPLRMVGDHEGFADQHAMAASRAAISGAISAALSAIGFSHRTCLPAWAALIDHSMCCEVGSGI